MFSNIKIKDLFHVHEALYKTNLKKHFLHLLV